MEKKQQQTVSLTLMETPVTITFGPFVTAALQGKDWAAPLLSSEKTIEVDVEEENVFSMIACAPYTLGAAKNTLVLSQTKRVSEHILRKLSPGHLEDVPSCFRQVWESAPAGSWLYPQIDSVLEFKNIHHVKECLFVAHPFFTSTILHKLPSDVIDLIIIVDLPRYPEHPYAKKICDHFPDARILKMVVLSAYFV